MKTLNLSLAAAFVTFPASCWACLEPVLTPAEELARQQAATTVHWGVFFAALAWGLYRARAPLGALLAGWRARAAAAIDAEAATRLVTRLTLGFAAASCILVLYGNIQGSSLPDEGCGGNGLLLLRR